MPRRSLPKIKGQLDLSQTFLPMESGFPTNIQRDASAYVNPEELVERIPYKALEGLSSDELSMRLFHRVAPIELEIGCGKGMFITHAASARPDHNFWGVEIAYRYALLCASKLAKIQAKNAVIMNADAAKVLNELIPDDALTAVHIYFPDPWWKKAHRKRRIVRPDVVQTIEKKLQKSRTLHFWTDVEEYYLSGVEIIKSSTNLTGPFPVPERPSADPMDFHTHFERRTRLNEQPVYRSYFVKE